MTKTSNFYEYYRHTCCFYLFSSFSFPWNFPIAHFRLSSSNHFISVFTSALERSSAVRTSISVRLKSLARIRHIVGDSLSGPTSTRLLRMRRGRDDIMRLQRRKCNGSYILSFPLIPPSIFTRASHRPLFFLQPTLFNLILIELWRPCSIREKPSNISFS